MSPEAKMELMLFFSALFFVALVALVLGCASIPEAARQRRAISSEFERCAASLSDAQCAIIYRERCALHGLGGDCYAEFRW